ncbi:hypothetical protein J5X07_08140 [Actinomyces bowdenii]|uniref:DUF6301 family protein n=1 Tax=Actinomyces bowdenii TaxID=131109 RepID=UPI001ABD1428|nr:hypothetical protein [Actinomyces bowdenii]
MSEFRTLPVEEAVTWIRAWTDRVWPMTLHEALAIRDNLGWRPFPNEPDFFTTPLSQNGHWGGYISKSNEFDIKGISFDLSSPPSLEINEHNIRAANEALLLYAKNLDRIWGSRQIHTNTRETVHFRWKLSNRVSVSIIRTNVLVGVDIDSPWRTQVSEEYDRAMEDYE